MLWEADTGRPVGTLVRTSEALPVARQPKVATDQGHTFGLAFTRDGKWLLSAGSRSAGHDHGNVVFWDVESRKWRKATEHLEAPPTQWMRAASVPPDGK